MVAPSKRLASLCSTALPRYKGIKRTKPLSSILQQSLQGLSGQCPINSFFTVSVHA